MAAQISIDNTTHLIIEVGDEIFDSEDCFKILEVAAQPYGTDEIGVEYKATPDWRGWAIVMDCGTFEAAWLPISFIVSNIVDFE